MARIRAQIMANGVRDMRAAADADVLAIPDELAASSSDITFSRRPRSRASVSAATADRA